MADAPADPHATARANLRETVKWLAAALAAIAAVAVGGSPLTSLGSMALTDQRLQIAAVTLAAAMLCFLFGIAVILNLLIQPPFFLEQVTSDAKLLDYVNANSQDLLPPDYADLEGALDDRAEAAARIAANRNDPTGTAYRAALEDYNRLVPTLTNVNSLLALVHFQRLVRSARGWLFLWAVLGALSLAVFAWAANPPKPTSPVFQVVPAPPPARSR